MAASRPDEAHRVIGRGKEKDTVGMSRGERREAERKREGESERERSTLS